MKLLFVDDEPKVLSGIENALIFAPDCWEADYATSGERAIEALADKTYDVLVSDMKMPGLTGADVLEYAKDNHPDTVRIVLSGEVDRDLAERAMPLTHEFVSKPCDPDALFAIIARVYASARSLRHADVDNILHLLDHLPAQPVFHARVQDAIQRGASAGDVAGVIENDLAISAAVLKMANSAFYGFKAPAKSVSEGVVRLGIQTVSGVVLNTQLRDCCNPDVAELFDTINSHATKLSELINSLIGDTAKEAGLAALLHDMGLLVLLSQLPDEYQTVVQQFVDGSADMDDSERRNFEVMHADVGASVAEMWNLDPVVIEVVRCHPDPSEVTGTARVIIDAMVAVEWALASDAPPPPEIDSGIVMRARDLIAGALEE